MIPASKATCIRSPGAGDCWKTFWYQVGVLGSAGRCFFDTGKHDPDETREGFLIPEFFCTA